MLLSVRASSRSRWGALTHEEVVGVWVWTTNLEQLHQVMELAVDITAHGHWAFLLHMCERFGSKGLELRAHTTGWTLDSSWRTSRACIFQVSLGPPDGWHASKEQRSQCSMVFWFVEEQGRRRRSIVSAGMLTFSQSL